MNEIAFNVVEDIFAEDSQHPLFGCLPLAIYVKAPDGKYLNRNQVATTMMLDAGFSKYPEIASIFGKTDKQLFGIQDGCLMEAHDAYLFDDPQRNTDVFLEHVTISTGTQLDLISKKQVLAHSDKQPLLMGCSLLLDNAVKNQLINKITVTQTNGSAYLIDLLKKCLYCNNIREIKTEGLLLRKLAKIARDPEFNMLSQLSQSELVCVCFIARGLSNKEIARLLDVSDRTLEVHIANSKRKLQCTHRHQLATWLWELITKRLFQLRGDTTI